MDPVEMYRRATSGAIDVMRTVTADQLGGATPCSQWSVQQLIDHMTGSTAYLQAALAGHDPEPTEGTGVADFAAGASAVLAGLAVSGAMDRVCMSPLGFEWPIAHAVMGTMMDTLIHTWDLATAIGQPVTLDPALVDTCIAMFLPDMPDRGREGGLVGPPVAVAADAAPYVRLLGAMGRHA
jgi:uncharacterized protein (TIGR03086 family)